ncbi:MAG: 7-cyano-7-deazaguanine synthase QueC [Candidatus Omnitrophica bacterium]|nr:7-cyano-7-deazaguanine synthase QueC [Candidatus Omnitrophota bacterium]
MKPKHTHGKKLHDKKAIVLLSGGLDSVTTLYYAKQQGYTLNALIFNYQQRHVKEIERAKRIAILNGIHYNVVSVDLGWVHSSLTDKKIPIPKSRNLKKSEIPVTYVAGRNIIFLSYAVSYAESIGAKKIFIGAHIQDYSGYPDCRPQFLKSFQRAVNLGTAKAGMEIIAPLIDLSKKEIIKMGLALKVPFEYTWSCYSGGKTPCLKCDSCRFRIQAFRQLGMEDPLLKNI